MQLKVFDAALALLLMAKVTKTWGQRSCMSGSAAGRNTSQSCECSGAIPLGLAALHRSGHLHMVGGVAAFHGKPPIRSAHPTNAAQCVECCVCYKSRKFETLFASLTRSTNFCAIFASISPPVCKANPGSLPALRRLRYCYSGKVFPRTPFCLSAKQ